MQKMCKETTIPATSGDRMPRAEPRKHAAKKVVSIEQKVEQEILDHQKWCKFKSRRSWKGPLDRVGKDFCWTFEPEKYRKARLEDGVSAKDAQNNFEVGHEYT